MTRFLERLLALTILALGMILAPLGPVRASDTSDALAQWLAGQEETGLKALRALAASGGQQAQLALGLIDAEPLYHGPWLQSRDRAARIALLRQPGGLSGTSWLLQMQVDPAPLWRAAWDGGATAALVPDFLARGEDRAALVVAMRLVARQKRGFDRLALDAGSPGWLDLLALRDRAMAAGQDPRTQPLPASVEPGDPAVAFVLGGALPDAAALAQWLGQDPVAAPIRSYCSAYCASQPPDICHAELFNTIGGYGALVRVRSPSPGLIGEADFAASPVAHWMLDQLAADWDGKARRNGSDGPSCLR